MLRRWIETAVIIAGTLGFWGFVYPELTLTEEIYIREEREQKSDNSRMSLQIGELRIKSRLLEYILGETERIGYEERGCADRRL